jgi:hypothetical protein
MSSLTKAAGSFMGGRAAKKSAQFDAKQLKRRAGETRATSQRQSNEERREARYVLSRARAVAASQGGALDDPTMVNVFADIEAEGEYNALARLYEGESAARADSRQARARRREGNAAMNAAYFETAGHLFDAADGGSFGSSAQTFARKYG